MPKTGYKIIQNINQIFDNGPAFGDVVDNNYTVNLSTSSFSSSVDEQTFFHRSFSPIDCKEGFNTPPAPILTSLVTGSQRGFFNLSFVSESFEKGYLNITASVSQKETFTNAEIFSSSVASPLPISSSFVSGTVFFKAVLSGSGTSPDPSNDSAPLNFIYDEIIRPETKGNVSIRFVNNLSSDMEVKIKSLRGNSLNFISASEVFIYDYSDCPVTGAWCSKGISPDLNITIKGGANGSRGTFIQRNTQGSNNSTHTSGSGFTSPLIDLDTSNTFTPDEGINFIIRQLEYPIDDTTTTFSLLEVLPTDSGSASVTDHTLTPTIRFGSAPLISQDAACADSRINFKEKTYFQLGGRLYNSRADAETKTKPSFPFKTNFILTDVSTFLEIDSEGYIQAEKTCKLPTFEIFTQDGSFTTQEKACKRQKNLAGSETFTSKDNKLTGDGRLLSGRFPLNNESRGGRNIILSAGNIVGFETCGGELETLELSIYGYPSSSYPFNTPELINPEKLAVACGDDTFTTYYQGDEGIYFGNTGSLAYDLVGDGGYYYKNTSDEFLLLSEGLILSSSSPC